MSDTDKITDFRDFVEAVRKAITASDPSKRELLTKTIAAYQRDFPDEYYWAAGPQAPAFLCGLMAQIISAASCQGEKCDFDLASVPAQGRA